MTAVVLNYLDHQQTLECIRSLMQQEYAPLQCVVVDNASPNDSFSQLTFGLSSVSGVTVLAAPSNRGYATGNNFGSAWAIEHHAPRYILILNPDVQLNDRSAVATMVRFAESHPDAGAVSPKVILPNGFVQGPYRRPNIALASLNFLFPLLWLIMRVYHQHKYRAIRRPTRCFRTIGACMLLRADVFARVGMFDEKTFLENEEPILAERLKRVGQFFYHLPTVTALHNHSRPGNSRYSLAGLTYYFRTYRRASKLATRCLVWSSQLYGIFYAPLKRLMRFEQ